MFSKSGVRTRSQKSLHDVTGQTARPTGGAAGAEPSKGHLQDALLTLGSAHAHFGHVQVSQTSGLISLLASVRSLMICKVAACNIYYWSVYAVDAFQRSLYIHHIVCPVTTSHLHTMLVTPICSASLLDQFQMSMKASTKARSPSSSAYSKPACFACRKLS